MIPGPDVVLFCPACRTPARLQTLISGNNFGRIVWSDGYERAPMLPVPPPLVSCGACGKVHWLHQAIEGESLPRRDAPHSEDQRVWARAPYVEAAKAAEILPALENGLAADPQAEFEARRLAWWDSNHAERSRDEVARYLARLPSSHPQRSRELAPPTPMSEAMTQNLDRLLELLRDQDDDDDRLVKAEILRELGRFDEALAELRFAFFTAETAQASFKQQLESLCEKSNRNVCRIEFFERR